MKRSFLPPARVCALRLGIRRLALRRRVRARSERQARRARADRVHTSCRRGRRHEDHSRHARLPGIAGGDGLQSDGGRATRWACPTRSAATRPPELVHLRRRRGRHDGTMGAWNCEPFANVIAVIAIFDRLLDTAPLDPGDAAGADRRRHGDGRRRRAGTCSPTTRPTARRRADLQPVRPGVLRQLPGQGPSLFSVPEPEFPSGATITISLDAQQGPAPRTARRRSRARACCRTAAGVHDGAVRAPRDGRPDA